MKRRFYLDIFDTGTVSFGSEDDIRFDQYESLSSDIDAMLAHIKDTYYGVIGQVRQQ